MLLITLDPRKDQLPLPSLSVLQIDHLLPRNRIDLASNQVRKPAALWWPRHTQQLELSFVESALACTCAVEQLFCQFHNQYHLIISSVQGGLPIANPGQELATRSRETQFRTWDGRFSESPRRTLTNRKPIALSWHGLTAFPRSVGNLYAGRFVLPAVLVSPVSERYRRRPHGDP